MHTPAGTQLHISIHIDTHANRCSHKACKFHYTSKTPPKKRIWVNLVNTGSDMPQELRGGVCAQTSVSLCVFACV